MTALATSMLERNLRALSRGSPELAERLAHTPPRDDLSFLPTDDGPLAIETGEGSRRQALCSRRRPRDEAEALIRPVDIADAAVFLVSGFGAGYHVEALARKLKKTGVIVVFEPDLALLRAVLERIDCSPWLGSMNVAVVDRPDDSGALARLVDGIEGLVAMGVTLVEHPPSRARLGDGTRRLHEQFLDIVKAVKMTVVTTMVQVKPTLRNLTQNLDRYAASPGVAELAGCCAGRAAVVVSAGPSLQRNIDRLTDPAVRERFVIVAVQTVLKPLLARGVRPHLVTALDHSEISTRFYEGLTRDDAAGITLIADPKVNPAVVDAWARLGGRLRMPGDRNLDKLLGADLARERGWLNAGATVAHLAYYVARHLGCDPVALIGQDLGFTDGQYYAAGAAIHNLWAPELNEFNTLEMLEWQRILRMGAHLRQATDVLGRPIYTDEQMATYLVQFERDFKADALKGLTTIDATEGGVRKQHTRVQTLADFLAEHARRAGPESIDTLLAAAERRAAGAGGVNAVGTRRLEDRVAAVRNDAARIAESSRQAGLLIAEMLEHHADQARVNKLITRLEKVRDSAVTRQPAFDLAQTLNQSGVFNRLRADRALQLASEGGGVSPVERQRLQLERDRENVRTLAAAAADLAELLDDSLAMLRSGGERRVTRDRGPAARDAEGEVVAVAPVTVAAVVPVWGGDQTHLGEPVFDGRNALELTIERLARCSQLGRGGEGNARKGGRILILTDQPGAVAGWLKRRPRAEHGPSVEVVEVRPDPGALARRRAVRAARLLARDCWRGGIANQSAYDEVFDPQLVRDAAREHDLDAVLLVGPDWAAIDPDLCDAAIERFRRNPAHSRFTFTQAPPGVCGCVLSRSLLDDFAAAGPRSGVFASIGGLLGYIPWTPIVDLINLPECVAIDPRLRDIGRRLIADTPAGRSLIGGLYRRTGSVERLRWEHAAAATETGDGPAAPPTHLVVHAGGGTMDAPRWIDAAAARTAIASFAGVAAGERAVVSLRADDPLSGVDPLDHPALDELLAACASGGLEVHVRTPLTSTRFDESALLDGSISILSVDLLAESAGAYRAITGRDDGDRVRTRFDSLAARRAAQAGGATWAVPWIVPRLTRCDASYGEIDPFFRPRIIGCGWAVIDPLLPSESPPPGERIAPLPVPATAAARLGAATRVVGIDGRERPRP